MSRAEPPSGAQHRIGSGDQEATVVEVGGGLRTYTAAGHDVLDGHGLTERCSGARGQVLMPWPNRIGDGRYRFGGVDEQLALTEPDRHNASHGLVRWSNWTAAVHEADRVVMELLLHPQPGYPHVLGLAVDYRLGPAGLTVASTATNLGDGPCPFGAGFHPYLTVGTARADEAVLHVPAATRLVTDDRGVPTGAVAVDGTPFDFRRPRGIGDLRLDTAYTDLSRPEVVLAAPGGARRVTVWLGPSYSWVMVFTGDTLGPSRRRRGVAVEPMTCAPNAFVSGDGLRALEPGQSWTDSWGIAPGPGR